MTVPDLERLDLERLDLERIDLERIESDLADVAAALARLDDERYWACEVCGAAIHDVVTIDPLARRCPEHAGF